MFYFIFFLVGAVLGSFLLVVVMRLRRQESFLSGRSYCPACRQQLEWFELIPLFSFVWQRGKCRHCGGKISFVYPAVELATGLAFVLVWHNLASQLSQTNLSVFSLSWQLTGLLVLVSLLVIIFVYDLKYYLILDVVTLPAMFTAIVWRLGMDFSWQQFLNLILAGLVAGGFFLLQFVISDGKWIGGGDIRLGLLMGFILGWPDVLVALALAYFSGAFLSLFLLVGRKKKWGSQVPFGTFLTLGTFLALLYAQPLIDWYLTLL